MRNHICTWRSHSEKIPPPLPPRAVVRSAKSVMFCLSQQHCSQFCSGSCCGCSVNLGKTKLRTSEPIRIGMEAFGEPGEVCCYSGRCQPALLTLYKQKLQLFERCCCLPTRLWVSQPPSQQDTFHACQPTGNHRAETFPFPQPSATFCTFHSQNNLHKRNAALENHLIPLAQGHAGNTSPHKNSKGILGKQRFPPRAYS